MVQNRPVIHLSLPKKTTTGLLLVIVELSLYHMVNLRVSYQGFKQHGHLDHDQVMGSLAPRHTALQI